MKLDFMQYNPRATSNAFGKVRYNQLQFLKAIEELQKQVAELNAEIKALKDKRQTKEAK